jgi:hypothetical protein
MVKTMNTFMENMKAQSNYGYTENGAVKHTSTLNKVLDMFAMGGAYRQRSEEDCILLFKEAFEAHRDTALRCLFYLRDVRGGQGERRFFRVCFKWLCNSYPVVARKQLSRVSEYGRWDDVLYATENTPVFEDALKMLGEQFVLDIQCKTPSLLAKWLPSENASSAATKRMAVKVRKSFGLSSREYRKALSMLRARINVLERLMSANKWDEIEFDKIPSRAGMIYKNAFARHDIERAKSEKAVQTYEQFAKDTTKAVNAKALYPYECVAEAMKLWRTGSYWNVKPLPPMDDTNRLMVNKYWDNLTDYFNGATFNGLAVVDTSGSMVHDKATAPINVAISLGLYCAEKAKGPFAGHYVSFASRPQLIATDGVDFCDKVYRIYKTNLVDNTNIEAAFDLLLDVAIRNHCSQDEIPQNLLIISDMEFDAARGVGGWRYSGHGNSNIRTLMENIRAKWASRGYAMPKLIYWNVDARQNNIADDGPNVSYVSGFSPAIFQQIMSGKTGYDLMMEKLDAPRYKAIQ